MTRVRPIDASVSSQNRFRLIVSTSASVRSSPIWSILLGNSCWETFNRAPITAGPSQNWPAAAALSFVTRRSTGAMRAAHAALRSAITPAGRGRSRGSGGAVERILARVRQRGEEERLLALGARGPPPSLL
jgi:hypothetical protein